LVLSSGLTQNISRRKINKTKQTAAVQN